MSKKIIMETSNVEIDAKTGEVKSQRSCQVAKLSAEDKYFKFYFEGLIYISDMPKECSKLLYYLLDNMTYVDQKTEGLGEYGMHIFLNADIKRGIAKKLGIKNYRCIDNTLQMLIKGEVLCRVSKGVYRPNPYIIARGGWQEICHLREEWGCPLPAGETFQAVYERKENARKQMKEMAAVQAEHQAEQSTTDEA